MSPSDDERRVRHPKEVGCPRCGQPAGSPCRWSFGVVDDLHCTERFLALGGRHHEGSFPVSSAPVTGAGEAPEGATGPAEAADVPPRGEPAAPPSGKKDGPKHRAAGRTPTDTDGAPTLF